MIGHYSNQHCWMVLEIYWRLGGTMICALDCRWFEPWPVHCLAFLGKTLYSHRATLCPHPHPPPPPQRGTPIYGLNRDIPLHRMWFALSSLNISFISASLSLSQVWSAFLPEETRVHSGGWPRAHFPKQRLVTKPTLNRVYNSLIIYII